MRAKMRRLPRSMNELSRAVIRASPCEVGLYPRLKPVGHLNELARLHLTKHFVVGVQEPRVAARQAAVSSAHAVDDGLPGREE